MADTPEPGGERPAAAHSAGEWLVWLEAEIDREEQPGGDPERANYLWSEWLTTYKGLLRSVPTGANYGERVQIANTAERGRLAIAGAVSEPTDQ